MATPRQSSARGFTLVELMTVVTIVGVISVIGVAFVGKHLRASRTAEALAMVQSIRAAQESYRAESRRYLNVSTSLVEYYPAKPDGLARSFYTTGTTQTDVNWRLLRPIVSGPVRFGYAVMAGDSGATPPSPTVANAPTFGVATSPFYVIQATGDMNNDGVFCHVAATSFSRETYVENEGE
jgi:prepilin-type N-terminal cleavage/methylation domain-containing protein